jgi:hypothetical protein
LATGGGEDSVGELGKIPWIGAIGRQNTISAQTPVGLD